MAQDFENVIESAGYTRLAIAIGHANRAGALAINHKDPFDRLLIARALIEGLILVSNEKLFDGFGVQRLW